MESFATQGFSFDLPKGNSSIIKVIGVGGGGNNALKHMYETGIHGVDFVVCNTDAQTLDNNPVANKVQLGASTTEGLGAGADPDVGEKAAIESMDEIKAALGQNTKMVFITAGMGGGTGTGAAPVIAKVAKEMGILTIGIVTVPFSFEGKRRLEQAEIGLDKLRSNVDSLIVINNDKLRQQFGDLGFKQGFAKADEVLTNAAKGMAEVITGYFDVNIDFRDAKSVLQNSGTALMSTGRAQGENKAEEAVKKALDSPLLNDNKITGAKNVLLLIRSGNEEVTMDEIGVIMDHIQKEAGHTADIIFGVGTDEELGDAVSVLVIATGFAKDNRKYDGPTEKIRFSLEDAQGARRESPFKTKAEVQGNAEPSSENVFRLDDEEDRNFDLQDGDRPSMSMGTNPMMVLDTPEVETQTQSDSLELDLFSFEDSEGDLQPESFSFETEAPKNDSLKDLSQDEQPVEFAFKITDQPIQDAQKPIEEALQDTSSSEEKLTPSSINHLDPVQDIPKEEAFTFIDKPVDQDKVRERRNKLKEFNSRYQIVDEKNEFETIPAFRRKNISLGDQHHSNATIGSFLTEEEVPRVRENQYLNKDVD